MVRSALPPAPAPGDAITLDDLQQRPEEHLRKLRESGGAATLRLQGRDELVVLDRGAFDRLTEELDRLETIELLRQRSERARQGEGRPAREFFQELAQKHGIELEP